MLCCDWAAKSSFKTFASIAAYNGCRRDGFLLSGTFAISGASYLKVNCARPPSIEDMDNFSIEVGHAFGGRISPGVNPS